MLQMLLHVTLFWTKIWYCSYRIHTNNHLMKTYRPIFSHCQMLLGSYNPFNTYFTSDQHKGKSYDDHRKITVLLQTTARLILCQFILEERQMVWWESNSHGYLGCLLFFLWSGNLWIIPSFIVVIDWWYHGLFASVT